jgi:hypothetical protein
MKAIYRVLKALTAASAVTWALAGFAPVTMRPSVMVNASQGPAGDTSTVNHQEKQ